MKLFFSSLRTISRNFGMVWPPFVTLAVFLLIGLIPLVAIIIQLGMAMAGSVSDDMSALDLFVLARATLGMKLVGFILFAIVYFVLFMLLSVFMYGAMYSMVSGVLNSDRHYWKNFFRGGLRYFGWSILYGIITGAIGLIIQIIIESAVTGQAFNEQFSFTASALNTVAAIIVYFLFALFLPALVDGKERFMDAMGTSFRLAWKTFLTTILPIILFALFMIVISLAIVALGYLFHPLVSILLFIPVALFLVPLFPIWMTLVYRHLTGKPLPDGPQPPADDGPNTPLPPHAAE